MPGKPPYVAWARPVYWTHRSAPRRQTQDGLARSGGRDRTGERRPDPNSITVANNRRGGVTASSLWGKRGAAKALIRSSGNPDARLGGARPHEAEESNRTDPGG